MLSIREIADIAIMTVAVGYIFMDLFIPRTVRLLRGFDWKALWFACMVTAPALIAHELAHKFTALLSGLQATFHAAYTWLGIGVVLKLIHSPIIFFVPGFVSIECAVQPCITTPITMAATAFAGPLLNLTLYAISWLVLKNRRRMARKKFMFWIVTKHVNGFLFILNMLPLPGFDGFKVYASLWQAFG